MVAMYSLHHRLSLSTRPSLATHRSPSCQRQPLVLSFHNKSDIYNPYSLTLAAGYSCAAKQNGDHKSKEQPQRRRPILKSRGYFFNTLTRGKQELMDMLFRIQEQALAVDSPASAMDEFKNLLEESGPGPDPEKLQEAAWKLEMSGKEDKAVQMLEKKLSEMKPGIEEQNLRLLISELWIYQGKYKQAKEQCESLKGQGSIRKLPLYLAVIYELMGDTKTSKYMWEDVQKGSISTMVSSISKETLSDLQSNEIGEIMGELDIKNMNFPDFQKLVQELREEIERGSRYNKH